MDFLTNLELLSSTGLVGWLFEILGTAGNWADAAVDLIGLI